MILRWILALVLLLGSLWMGNLAFFNWWAAGGPPTPHPETYVFRGNIFFALACLFIVSFVIVVAMNVKRKKQG
jgi:hypothetical protein